MTRGMAVAPQPQALEAGALALERGGNTVDAAIACALVQSAAHPRMCGIAGLGTRQLYLPGSGSHGARGYPIQRRYLSYCFAGIHGPRRGGWDGGADPRRDGMALAV